MNNAGVNLPFGADDLLLQFLVVQLLLQVAQLIVIRAHLLGEDVPVHRIGNGRPHGGYVKGLGQIVTRPQAQRLAGCLYRLVSRQHDHLDGRINFLELAQQFDPRHPRHANVQHRRVHGMLPDQFDGLAAIVGQQDGVVVLEDDPQGLAGTLLVVHNQQCELARTEGRRGGRLGKCFQRR